MIFPRNAVYIFAAVSTAPNIARFNDTLRLRHSMFSALISLKLQLG